MFKPTVVQPLHKLQETRAMVAFYENLDAIKAAIAEYDAAVDHASDAETKAYDAVKAAELKAAMVSQKESVVDKLIQANVEALQKTQKDIDAAKKMQADYEAKEAAMAQWEAAAIIKETDYSDKMTRLVNWDKEVSAREEVVTAREETLQSKLDAFKGV